VNIYTCCNGVYKNFIPIFILSNLYHNEDSFVEVGVDLINEIDLTESLNVLNKKYPNRFLIRKANFDKIVIKGKHYNTIPNTVRFIDEPIVKAKYVYISDIDIINLEKNICDLHINHMNNNGLPFSNIVRNYDTPKEYKRLTGLHFTPYENYYPIPDYEDLILEGVFTRSDEAFLYKLVKKRYNNINEEIQWRPVHGIHVSPNREPTGNMNWGMSNWQNQWIEFRNSEIFQEIEPTFTNYIKEKIKTIDTYYGK
jgi:hypothetical protein